MLKEVIIYTYEQEGIDGLLSLLILSAFSKKQRESIRDERDGARCHFPGEHVCNDKLEVHHIIPQRYAEWIGVDPDYPANGLTVCSNAHDLVHPDRVKAKKSYWREKLRGKDSFKTMGQERDQKLRDRQIYWTDKWDRLMAVIALKLTQEAEKRGWEFPES